MGTELLTQEAWPYVPQIEIALRRAYDSICSVGLHPVSVLKYSMSKPYGIGRPSIVSFSTDSKHIQIAYEWELEGTEMPICVYSSITGELQKEKLVDYVCEDSMNNIGYEKCISIEKNGEEFWSPDKSFMLKVFDNRCVLYKKNSTPNYIKYPVYWGDDLEKNSISRDSKYAIFGDSIFHFLSGKSMRHLGTHYVGQHAVFSPNDKYIVISSWNDNIIAVEDFQTKKILSKIGISKNALTPIFNKDDNLYVPVWEDSFYVYKIPSLEIIDKGVADSEKEEYSIDIQGKNINLLLNRKIIQTLKNILPEGYIQEEYVSFEMLDNNRKILITYIYECMLWDLEKNELLTKWYFGNNRYTGIKYNNDKSQLLAYNGFEMTIYDTSSGLILFDKRPSEECLSYDGFAGTFSRDERYVIHGIDNHGDMSCDNSWESMVYIYEFLTIDDLIKNCRKYIGNRKLTQKEKIEFYLEDGKRVDH